MLRFSYNGNDYNIEYPSIYQAEKALSLWLKKAKIQNAKIVVTR
jgi:hypothetical protein